MSRVVGIDLGTTNSLVVIMEGRTPKVIPSAVGARTMASVVAFTQSGERLVGQIAKRQAITNPQSTIFGVKRLVGRRFDSDAVAQAQRCSPYRIVKGPNGDARVQIGERLVSPQEIEAYVLHELKRSAEAYLGEPVEAAIVSVPAYFNDCQRQATLDAGGLAGLNVLRVLNEATAAALAYGVESGRRTRLAVYDLGGGTFDVSILEMDEGIYQVLATAGDTYLGGQNFDELIASRLVLEFADATGIDLGRDPMALQRLMEAAEKAKCELSWRRQAEIWLPFITADAIGPKHLKRILTRDELDQMLAPMLDHTASLCHQALRDAGLRASDIDAVVPVGGQTRAPAVWATMRRVFGREPERSVNPDEAVAIGVAIQTGILQGEVTDVVLLDVTPHTLGIETTNDTLTMLIERNSNIPTKKTRLFTTTTDDQTRVAVHVLQGEAGTASENTSLGRFVLEGLAPRKAGELPVEVTFEIDVNGIVHVSALDLYSGRSRQITVHATGGLTQSELEAARAALRQPFR